MAEAQAFEGCDGGNRSPALNWRGAPAGTQSFAVTVYDPDAPTGSGWYIFTVHALGVPRLALPADASSAMVGYMIQANRLGSATLEATYGR
ncbi:MAG TPA: hypothetical protein VLA61_18540 [Ideonella sp.]|uniref:YbhB/YbcL family Raf kinase inhibitor-like protein n=1 Tax=Ideonella sp. TaxID=1929293 RepID=UPI002B917247|nr:hypothetical protein [Ideonella sp.]HSI50275.1 hypothetical protein [Ideonella sp.]